MDQENPKTMSLIRAFVFLVSFTVSLFLVGFPVYFIWRESLYTGIYLAIISISGVIVVSYSLSNLITKKTSGIQRSQSDNIKRSDCVLAFLWIKIFIVGSLLSPIIVFAEIAGKNTNPFLVLGTLSLAIIWGLIYYRCPACLTLVHSGFNVLGRTGIYRLDFNAYTCRKCGARLRKNPSLSKKAMSPPN
jgi:hypothetical protein